MAKKTIEAWTLVSGGNVISIESKGKRGVAICDSHEWAKILVETVPSERRVSPYRIGSSADGETLTDILIACKDARHAGYWQFVGDTAEWFSFVEETNQ